MILADPGVAIPGGPELTLSWCRRCNAGLLAPPLMAHRMTGLPGPVLVPEVQGGMLAPPFMDHLMTLESGLMKPTTKPTHGMGSNTKLRQRTQVEDPGRSCSHRTPRTLDTPCGLSPIVLAGGRRSRGLPNGHSVPNPPRVAWEMSTAFTFQNVG